MSLEIPTQMKKRKSKGDIRGPCKRIETTCVQHHEYAYDLEGAQHDYMQDLVLEHEISAAKYLQSPRLSLKRNG
jgi:hypothetical protein